ncbi:MAG: flagellar basal-body rod modification protein FlgD [Rhodospirillaceae bacterium]|nr:MAG: flagellar basal-body rod modification protein FlgD [Rhodospirillaceae bacterium]
MATDPLAATGATASTSADASKAGASRNKLAKDLDTFLTLLTTQLKYQDPLSPMDSTQFTNQLVQFANVEQQIQVNTNLETMIGLQSGNQAALAIGYLGTTVEAEGGSFPLQDGVASFGYNVPQELASSSIVIRDSSGAVVYTAQGETKVGQKEFTWKGTDNFGFPLDDGTYEVSVTGRTADGAENQLVTTVTGTVTGIETRDNQVYLSLGGVDVALANIKGVVKEPTKTTAP